MERNVLLSSHHDFSLIIHNRNLGYPIYLMHLCIYGKYTFINQEFTQENITD